jgi:WD40-like Beta Propeller Repeat
MSRWTRIRPPTGRHVNVRSPLSRLEWGTAGRHRRRVRRGLIGGGIIVVLAAGAATWFFFFRGNGGSASPVQASQPACASARLPGHLGALAWIDDGKLMVRSLDSCAQRTLVSKDAAPPVRFSPDGKWIAYGSGTVVSATSGSAAHALGSVASWRWAAQGHTLIGVAKDGRVLVGQPVEAPSLVLVHGAGGAAIDPRGKNVAVAVKHKVVVHSVNGGSGKVLFSGPSKSIVKVWGWSPDGRWVVFWDLEPGKTEGPLDAAPVSGAGYHNVFDPVPAYDDFLTWCGDTLVASGGGGDLVSQGQQLLVSQAPLWQTHDLSRDFRSSWIWPSCSPNGKWIAVTVTPNHTEYPPGQGDRRVELISIDGNKRVKLALGAGVFELPRWSADGQTLLVIKRHRNPKVGGAVELVLINPKNGKILKTVPNAAQLPAARTPKGHTGWTSITDWYRG